ncbi:Selenoprotein O [Oopsacas minuta]|uniref:Selenoprotein O n=1 Tax=Oopsacas minuta TaxID=111878 RepID=A0AAV7JCY6_9METZ|nr:Selenoprotein O [Oopsacas minuta]
MESLKFNNRALQQLPIDRDEQNYVRTVTGACFSRLQPTPVENPTLVAHSKSALSLLDIDPDKESIDSFVEYFSGNKVLPGSEPAAHCYCGHQFGYFSGQLGDGAAIYLGEVINGKGERWELQLKGAGKTPYSRTADGRKVLRSSIREFLCSEAMYNLGVPTTRAGSCITSDSRVVRDIFYSGNPIEERCTIVSRIAPTFIRFGSFEIFKTRDQQTARQGPSLGRQDIKQQLVEYCISTFFPEIYAKEIPLLEKTREFYREVVRSTAVLVSHWQTVGFCHGVLNTDNMSIMGLTIDYGPFGFMDHYDPDFICNGSDDGGRYKFSSQPEICGWNLRKLAEALDPVLPLSEGQLVIKEEYMRVYEREYITKMRSKLGLLQEMEGDLELVNTLLDTMHRTFADFTNTFRNLNLMLVPGVEGFEASKIACLNKILSQCSTIDELKKVSTPKMDPRQMELILQLMQQSPQFADERMISKVKSELDKINSHKDLGKMNQEQKQEEDSALWCAWLDKYSERLRMETGSDSTSINTARISVMNRNNPIMVLRNYVAQAAIEAAEKGDYTEVNKVLELLQQPYSQPADTVVTPEAATPHISNNYSERPPINALGICVT